MNKKDIIYSSNEKLKNLKENNFKILKNIEKEKITNISILEFNYLVKEEEFQSNFLRLIENKIIDDILYKEKIKKEKLRNILQINNMDQ
jgi:hypothetical protein